MFPLIIQTFTVGKKKCLYLKTTRGAAPSAGRKWPEKKRKPSLGTKGRGRVLVIERTPRDAVRHAIKAAEMV